jgi:site-specific DNA-methyltransferase (adenine-specific)
MRRGAHIADSCEDGAQRVAGCMNSAKFSAGRPTGDPNVHDGLRPLAAPNDRRKISSRRPVTPRISPKLGRLAPTVDHFVVAEATTSTLRMDLPAGLPARVRAAVPTSKPARAVAVEDYWSAPDGRARLIRGDSLEVLEQLPEGSVDVIFADPPYFLSNNGTTCQAGKRVSVNKGKWDASMGAQDNHAFNKRWLAACQRLLSKDGTIWISGTAHVIFSVGYALQELGFKLLNDVVWEKPNPPPNLSCRYFTHSTELLLWAAKSQKSKHHFAYAQMKQRNGDKQMKNVWRFPAPGRGEKLHGKHPTQKPLALLERVLAASCPQGGRVLDPFNGSGTTGVAAAQRGLSYTGIERETEYLELSKKRLIEVVPEWGRKSKIAVAG